MPEQIAEEQIVETATQNTEDYGAQIPEHAILRLARFFLPKMQADLQQNENDHVRRPLPLAHLKKYM